MGRSLQEAAQEYVERYEATMTLGWGDDTAYALAKGVLAQARAISEASYLLDPNQGEPQNPSLAYQWLRTTFPIDHPNYVDPAALERQRDGQRHDESPFPFDESNIVERS